jgi:N-acetylmuramic acid 6-phosphate etherase
MTPLFLGIEGGGSHSVGLLADGAGILMARIEAGPGNIKLLDDAGLIALFRAFATQTPRPAAVGIGLAGARTETDWSRIRFAADKVWRGVPCHATNDLETAFAAASDADVKDSVARIMVLSGTGSCIYGKNDTGKTARVGGWGHLLGDGGSGYHIAMSALREAIFHFDRTGEWPALGARLLHRLEFCEPAEFIPWVQSAGKSEIASLAPEVFAAWFQRDKLASTIIAENAAILADDAAACASKLARRGSLVSFVFTGSILTKQPRFAALIAMKLRSSWPDAAVSSLNREGAWGAAKLAQQLFESKTAATQISGISAVEFEPEPPAPAGLESFAKLSPTEQRNPLSMNLDTMPVADAIRLMLGEDSKVPKAILKEAAKIEKVVGYIAHSFKNGGRLFYVGAGTSGRLGVLDASECPPTFRSAPEMVQGIIAGGQTALWHPVEGAEDDPKAGALAIQCRNAGPQDVVVGIAASGRTPFVWGALAEAGKRGAKTVMLAFNPYLTIPDDACPDVVITPDIGPEILTGSTRLKSGTATKLILNIFTTLAMVRIGKVVGNLMVDLNPSNLKLRDRATRIVRELCEVDYEGAQRALESSGWIVKDACKRLRGRKR